MSKQNLEKYKSLQSRIWYEHQEHHKSNTDKNKITINLWNLQLQFEWKQSFYIFITKSRADFTYVLLNEKVRTDLKSSNCPCPETPNFYFFFSFFLFFLVCLALLDTEQMMTILHRD